MLYLIMLVSVVYAGLGLFSAIQHRHLVSVLTDRPIKFIVPLVAFMVGFNLLVFYPVLGILALVVVGFVYCPLLEYAHHKLTLRLERATGDHLSKCLLELYKLTSALKISTGSWYLADIGELKTTSYIDGVVLAGRVRTQVINKHQNIVNQAQHTAEWLLGLGPKPVCVRLDSTVAKTLMRYSSNGTLYVKLIKLLRPLIGGLASLDLLETKQALMLKLNYRITTSTHQTDSDLYVSHVSVRNDHVVFSSPLLARHHSLLQYSYLLGVDCFINETSSQGFLDSFGNYLTREKALALAMETNGLVKEELDRAFKDLYSETLF